MQYFISDESNKLAEEIQKIVTARKHKPFQSETEGHRKFLHLQYEKALALQERYPFLSFQEELQYFSSDPMFVPHNHVRSKS